MSPYPNNQRLIDLLKSLDLNWPDGNRFCIVFNNNVNVGMQSDTIKTATLSIEVKKTDEDDGTTSWEAIDLLLKNIEVGHA